MREGTSNESLPQTPAVLRQSWAETPVLVLAAGLTSFSPERSGPRRAVLAARLRAQLEQQALPRFLPRQRWFAARHRTIERVQIEVLREWSAAGASWLLTTLSVALRDDAPQRYFLPLAVAWEDTEGDPLPALAPVAVARVRHRARMGVLYDGFADAAFCRALVDGVGAGLRLPFGDGELAFTPSGGFAEVTRDLPDPPSQRRLGEGSNSTVVLGTHVFLKGYRRLRAGGNPEVEMGRFLAEHAPEVRVVPFGGALELRGTDGSVSALALLQRYLESQGDAWTHALGDLERFLGNALAAPPGRRRAPEEVHAAFCRLLGTLGRRTGELHRALAGACGDPAFDPEPVSPDDPRAWARQVAQEAEATLLLLRRELGGLDGRSRAAARALLARADRLGGPGLAALAAPVHAVKTRVHGDLHLGQVLILGDDVVLTDFEGEPARPLEARRSKHSPLRDVAGMLRSLDYAAQASLARVTAARPGALPMLEPLARAWETAARGAFLSGYRGAVSGSPAWPSGPGEAARLITLFALEKALYEVRYELASRPEWAAIPLEGLVRLLETPAGTGGSTP